MSCWITLAAAAEYMGESLEQIERRAVSGAWPMKIEHGFTVIDVAPNSPRYERPVAVPREIIEVPSVVPESALPHGRDGAVDVDAIEFDYRKARSATARHRRPPLGH